MHNNEIHIVYASVYHSACIVIKNDISFKKIDVAFGLSWVVKRMSNKQLPPESLEGAICMSSFQLKMHVISEGNRGCMDCPQWYQ